MPYQQNYFYSAVNRRDWFVCMKQIDFLVGHAPFNEQKRLLKRKRMKWKEVEIRARVTGHLHTTKQDNIDDGHCEIEVIALYRCQRRAILYHQFRRYLFHFDSFYSFVAPIMCLFPFLSIRSNVPFEMVIVLSTANCLLSSHSNFFESKCFFLLISEKNSKRREFGFTILQE